MIKNFIRKEQFNPSLIGIFINPFWISRITLWKSIKKYSSAMSGKLLDVGCGRKPYSPLFTVDQYIGIEIDSERSRITSSADVFYDGNVFPFFDGEFDCILCNQVLEHVFNPELFLQEINRVVKNDGFLLLSIPFAWDEHEQPHDYARYSSFGLTYLLEKNGFKIIKHTKTAADFRVFVQLINGYIFKVLPKNKVVLLIFNVLIIAPLTILGVLLSFFLPNNPDMFLDQIILAKKLKL